MGQENNSEYLDHLSTINDQVYRLKWEKLIGHDLIFDEYGEFVCKNSEHLDWDSGVKIQPKSKVKGDDVKLEGHDDKTLFYKQMLIKAQQKESADKSTD